MHADRSLNSMEAEQPEVVTREKKNILAVSL